MSEAFDEWWDHPEKYPLPPRRDGWLDGDKDFARCAFEAGRRAGQSEALDAVSRNCNRGLLGPCPGAKDGEHYNECNVAAALHAAHAALTEKTETPDAT
jgi:hypothetical protein